jgi:hypothetical protein
MRQHWRFAYLYTTLQADQDAGQAVPCVKEARSLGRRLYGIVPARIADADSILFRVWLGYHREWFFDLSLRDLSRDDAGTANL